MEVVVAVAPQSGSYREIDAQNGFVSAMLLLIVAVHSPWDFDPDMLLFWLVLGYAFGIFLSTRWARLRRLLTSPERRRAQVKTQAHATFLEQRVHSTRDRSGLLLFLSDFERLGAFVPDLGVEANLPRAELNNLESIWGQAKTQAEFEQSVLQGLESLVQPLATALPRRDDDENELSNEVIVTGGRR